MNKLMTLMIGLAFAFTTVAPTFAQEPPKKEEKKETKTKKSKGSKKKEGEGEKKGGAL
jgi:hypothetical protein